MTGVGIDGWMDGRMVGGETSLRSSQAEARRGAAVVYGSMGWTDGGEVTSRTVGLLEQTNST